MHGWDIRKIDGRVIDALANGLGLPPLEARLLAARGVGSIEDGRRFLDPSFDQLHDPFLFNEMAEAARLLREAITRRERILIHGDYDADGVCGTALLYDALSRLGADVHFFVPDRAKDGYGLARRVMDRGFEVGLRLVVSVDCGSSDREVVASLAERGVSVIVTDHHETAERIPEARAFINPKLPGERYPFRELTGAGVAFKLLQGLEKTMGADLRLRELLDLAALGTLGDSGAMLDENRIIVRCGLEELALWRRPGLAALRGMSSMPEKSFTARQVSFNIIPRINAPGRVKSAKAAVDLLTEKDPAAAARIAAEIDVQNEQRKELGNSVLNDVREYAKYRVWHEDPKALVFEGVTWHEGVIGIAAARLAEEYNVPSALIAVRNGRGKGSVRSAGKINVKEALERCSRYLEDHGGHREAGGFSIREDDIPGFKRLFEEVVEELVACPSERCTILADAGATLDDCTEELLAFVERIGPFGAANPEPIFLLRGLEVMDEGTRILREEHLRIAARDGNGATRDLIGFSMVGDWKPADIVGRRIDVLVNIRKDSYRKASGPQLQIHELRLSEPALDFGG